MQLYPHSAAHLSSTAATFGPHIKGTLETTVVQAFQPDICMALWPFWNRLQSYGVPANFGHQSPLKL